MTVEQKLEKAVGLLRLALLDLEHAPSCKWAEFERHNRFLPRTHPAWGHAPACNCLVTDVAKFLCET